MSDIAETVLERAIVSVQSGTLDFRTMMWTFAASHLFVASATEPAEDLGGVHPLVVQREGIDLLALFTSPGRAEVFAEGHPYLSVRIGFELLRWMPPGVGLVVNPGSTVGFEMQADGIARLRDEIEA